MEFSITGGEMVDTLGVTGLMLTQRAVREVIKQGGDNPTRTISGEVESEGELWQIQVTVNRAGV